MDIKEIFTTIYNNFNFSSIIWQILTPLIFSCGDIISGVIQAIVNKSLDSQKMRTGLLHKALVVLILFLSYVLTVSFNVSYIFEGVSFYIIAMETISIVENLNKAGIDLLGLAMLVKEKPENDTNENLNKLINTIDDKVSELNSQEDKKNE